MAPAANSYRRADMNQQVTLDELAKFAMNGAELNLDMHNDDLAPVVIGYNGHTNETHIVLITVPKDVMPTAITKFLSDKKATAYALVMEGWQTGFVASLADHDWNVTDMPADDRKEVVQVIAAEQGQQPISYQAEINRSADGERELGEWKPLGNFMGRFVITEW